MGDAAAASETDAAAGVVGVADDGPGDPSPAGEAAPCRLCAKVCCLVLSGAAIGAALVVVGMACAGDDGLPRWEGACKLFDVQPECAEELVAEGASSSASGSAAAAADPCTSVLLHPLSVIGFACAGLGALSGMGLALHSRCCR